MPLELLATVDPDSAAFKAGLIVGITFAAIVSAAIPIIGVSARVNEDPHATVGLHTVVGIALIMPGAPG
jgi:hypothetical protein